MKARIHRQQGASAHCGDLQHIQVKANVLRTVCKGLKPLVEAVGVTDEG
jgi:hypothetical protein